MMFNRLPADVINGDDLLFQQPQTGLGNYFPGPVGFAGGGETGFPGRKRTAGKRDRHSKIYTSQGPRDRRVRLSIGIARRFFDLQEMLGFDKPSKTMDWLLNKSTSAIKELQVKESRNGVVMEEKLKLGQGLETKSSSITEKDRHFQHKQQQSSAVKELRAKARARARARTREKMMSQIMTPNLELNPIIPPAHYHHEICRISGSNCCNSSSMIGGRKTNPSIWGFQQNLLISRDLGFQNENLGDFASPLYHPFYAILDQPKFFTSNN